MATSGSPLVPAFSAPGGSSAYTNSYSAPLLQGLGGIYAGQTKRVNDTFDRNLGTLTGDLYSRGLGNSSIVASANLGNEDRRQQALLDLSGQEASQRNQAYATGAGLGLQAYGIDTSSANQAAERAQQASEFTQSQKLQQQSLANQLAAAVQRSYGIGNYGGGYGGGQYGGNNLSSVYGGSVSYLGPNSMFSF